MKMMHNIRDVRGKFFFALGVVWQQPFFLGQRSKCMGWGGVMVDPSWDVAKRAWTILSVFLNKCLCLLPIYIQKIIRKIVFFSFRKIKETAQSFLLTEKICCYTTICPETALILGKGGAERLLRGSENKKWSWQGEHLMSSSPWTWEEAKEMRERRRRVLANFIMWYNCQIGQRTDNTHV